MTQEIKLLPCPICGKTDLDHHDYFADGKMRVRCAWCHCEAPEDAWNRRAAVGAAQPVVNQSLTTEREAFQRLLEYAESQICTHEETHRGGAIWEICDQCGAMWADDEGGRPEFAWPKEIEDARAALAQQASGHDREDAAPVAYLTRTEDGDPAMLFFDRAEAATYCADGEQPEPLILARAAKGE